MIGIGILIILILIGLSARFMTAVNTVVVREPWWKMPPYFGSAREHVCGGRDQYCMCSGDEVR